jgi:hypothetical protein
LATDSHTETTITPSGVRVLKTIQRWQHHLGGEAHCLIRLHVLAAPSKPVAVISEIRSNPEGRGIIDDVAAVADALLSDVPALIAPDPDTIVWIAHHGGFSYHDSFGQETFTETPLQWDGQG